jgi:hypothetical protein
MVCQKRRANRPVGVLCYIGGSLGTNAKRVSREAGSPEGCQGDFSMSEKSIFEEMRDQFWFDREDVPHEEKTIDVMRGDEVIATMKGNES